MKYVKGDIVELAKTGQYDVVMHGCNCFCNMGSGVAVAIRKQWPNAYAADLKTEKGSPLKLGSYSMHHDAALGIYIVNAYTQYKFGRAGQKYVEYAAIKRVCEAFAKGNSKILIPKIGAGLGGGDWAVIEKIFDHYLGDRVTCCVLEE